MDGRGGAAAGRHTGDPAPSLIPHSQSPFLVWTVRFDFQAFFFF